MLCAFSRDCLRWSREPLRPAVRQCNSSAFANKVCSAPNGHLCSTEHRPLRSGIAYLCEYAPQLPRKPHTHSTAQHTSCMRAGAERPHKCPPASRPATKHLAHVYSVHMERWTRNKKITTHTHIERLVQLVCVLRVCHHHGTHHHII